ncbi:hypothetical protein EAH89_26145 [Roseomonas nepalensis]|uniref:Uncharacterized protein n=1 Tax=Muricoccus nepalensis TaxID=1854500 RepID=A0A502F8G6_9PROT|nr:hypothetical protein [Roseomonas nepalensis]TPG45686.1 hypothetical protein EAH89_26145 [Roseomonas nepalensis]
MTTTAPDTSSRPDDAFWRPELAAFAEALLAAGGKPLDPLRGGDVAFHLETSSTDEIQIGMQMDETGEGREFLAVSLTLFPEETLNDATPQQTAAIIAGWLRDTAARLEAAAEGGA